MAKQRVSTSMSDHRTYDYEGTYRGYEFAVYKETDGTWIALSKENINGQVIIASMHRLKRDAVNAYADKVDNHLGVNNTSNDYQNAVYSGIPMFSVRLVRETDFKWSDREVIMNSNTAAEFLIPYFSDKDREEVVVVLLDAGNSVIGMHSLSKGGLISSVVDIRNIFKIAILGNAAAIILAHNHPSGNPDPSQADIDITRRVRDAGDVMNIPLIDHIIVADGRGYSFIRQV